MLLSLPLCCRYVPSQGDVVVFGAVGKPPNCKYVNALRWYNHIASYSDDEQLAYIHEHNYSVKM